MSVPANILQQVITYQESGLAAAVNFSAFVKTSNTKFKNFNSIEANLGDTVSFDLVPRFTTQNSLVVSFESSVQRVQNLTVDQQISTAFAFTAQQFIFNVEDYMQKFGRSAIAEIGANIEANVAQNAVTNTYRFYGNGVTPINSYNDLATALAFFRTYGVPKGEAKGYILDTSVPQVVTSGLAQFAPSRNDDIAMSWELGNFSNCEWYTSNLLATHTAGTEGDAGSTLTVVSVTKNADGGVISITFSGTDGASDSNSVKQYDKFQFVDNVSGQPNMRFLTFVGHKPSTAKVQFQSTADAASTGGSQVTVLVNPPLQAAAGKNQNINNEIAAGMQCQVLPSHRAGLLTAGNPLYLAMPRLPDEVPFPTANASDPDTGVSIRQYFGSQFGQNARGMVYDAIWGSTLVAEDSMALIYPL